VEHVILVDSNDNEVGTMEKMEAHRKGVLHRAFSVLLFNSDGEMLIQKRASSKYHSGGLWSNTCCSHPRPGEPMEEAVNRRLREELGVESSPIFSFKFEYKVKFSNDLIEHELDHVYVGSFDGEPKINENEISDWKFVDTNKLNSEIQSHPHKYSHWFKIILNRPEIMELTKAV